MSKVEFNAKKSILPNDVACKTKNIVIVLKKNKFSIAVSLVILFENITIIDCYSFQLSYLIHLIWFAFFSLGFFVAG
jgi:hypothetical protein